MPDDTATPSTDPQRSSANARAGSDWQKAANMATTFVLPLTFVGLVLGYLNFTATNRAQAQASAAYMFQDYLRVSLDPANAQFVNPTRALLCDRRYEEYASYALAVGEAIYSLSEEGRAWTSTISGIIEDHREYVRSDLLPLNEYTPEYQILIKRVEPNAGKRANRCST